jgi:hypothetical protein
LEEGWEWNEGGIKCLGGFVVEKGRTGRYDLHLPKENYTDMQLWGVMDYTIYNGRLNVANSIIKVAGGGDGNENTGQKQHLSRSKNRALEKAKIVPETSKAIDLVNKDLVLEQGKRVASLTLFEVAKDDGESGKGIESSTLNNAAKLNNDMKLQKMKMHEWAMIKDALEAGVPGTEDVAVLFMKEHFLYLFPIKFIES